MDKKKRKEILEQLAQKQLIEFRQNLPIDERNFLGLFDFLDVELGTHHCDHSTKLTETYLNKIEVSNVKDVIEWLAERGGYCDCEVLANVEDSFGYLERSKPNLPKKKIKKQKLNSLKTDFGFRMEKVPSPWILTETISEGSKKYSFQIGKNTNCIVRLLPDFETFQAENEKFWLDLWINETGLTYNNQDLVVERRELHNYSTFIVKCKSWTPVKIWCFPKTKNRWCLQMTTELSRCKNDIKEFEKLITNIE